MDYVWISRRYYESRMTYMQVIAEGEKKSAKINVSQKKGAIPEEFNRTPLPTALLEEGDSVLKLVERKPVNPQPRLELLMLYLSHFQSCQLL